MNTTGAKKVKNEYGEYITGEYNYRGFRLSNDNGTWNVYKLTEDGTPSDVLEFSTNHKVCAIIEIDKRLTAKRYYIAYGSNINTPQMAFRCPKAEVVGTSAIEGYELVFRGHPTHAVATIEPREGMSVPVLVWSITPSDEKALDEYEGFPRLYIKQDFSITLNGKTVKAMAYVMTNGKPQGTPSARYLTTIAEGYDEFDFKKKVLFDAAVALQASKQETNRFAPCPRCGNDSMRKEKLIYNCLSRRADIYVCERCGMSEALRDATQYNDDIMEWDMFK